MLIVPVVLSKKVSLAVPITIGGAATVTFAVSVGTHGSGLTAWMVVEGGGCEVDFGVADVMAIG